jgi:predicted peptidase
LIHGAKLFLRDDIRKNFPAIVVFPQCPRSSFWSSVKMQQDKDGKRTFSFNKMTEPTIAMKLANDLLHQVIKQYSVQKKKIYVGGLSMGGMGTFELAWRNPKLFAAAFPICGGGDPAGAKDIRKIKWWVFHGAKDDVVPSSYSETMVNALKKVKAKVKFTLYPDANHNSWDPAFAEPGLLPWLFAQKR